MGSKRQNLKAFLYRTAPLCLVGVMTALMLMPMQPEEKTRLMSAFWNFLHFPASFALFYICLNLKWLHGKTWSREVCSAVFVQALHTILELLQPLLHRSASWSDWFLGLAGVLAAYLVYKAFRGDAKAKRSWRLLGAFGLLVLAMMPTLAQGFDRVKVRDAFPLMGTFETRMELRRWNLYGFKGALSHEHASHGRRSARLVETRDFSYSGWFLEEMNADWSPYDTLVCSIFWTGKQLRKGDVRVDDLPESTYVQQGHFDFVLAPGENRLVVPLDRLFQTDSGRKIDGSKIWKFGISMLEKQDGSVLFVDGIRLE
ncbi:MAG: hypothetical protein VCG02_13125 [Verrucomicrobiota bacterium]